MKPISDGKLDVFEDAALEGAKRIMAYFKYEGTDPKIRDKARVGATAISAYARMRASETNRMAVELAIEKFSDPNVTPAPPALKAASK